MAVENICPVDFVMTGVIVKAQECDATDVAYRSGACDKRKSIILLLMQLCLYYEKG